MFQIYGGLILFLIRDGFIILSHIFSNSLLEDRNHLATQNKIVNNSLDRENVLLLFPEGSSFAKNKTMQFRP